MQPLDWSLRHVVTTTSPRSYDTPLVSSVQESYVQDYGVGVEVS